MPVDARTPNEKTVAPLAAAQFFVGNLQNPAHILVAISGGSDSTGLLLALHEATAGVGKDRLRLSAVTVDHALRAESADEACKVAMLCAELGIPHVTRRWDGAKPASGLSEASRLARYRLIAEVALETGADLVVTGIQSATSVKPWRCAPPATAAVIISVYPAWRTRFYTIAATGSCGRS
ncbi:tRNA(Ile)-lysidine synthase [Agrobacterium tumefaciens]|nr:tRNA(Ile)-lysidine synthase [Agrobacterium tumefaciens]